MTILPALFLGLLFIGVGYYTGWKMHNSEGRYHQMAGLNENEKTYVRKMSSYGSILCGFGWIIHGCIALKFPFQSISVFGKILMVLGIAFIVIPYIKFDRWL